MQSLAPAISFIEDFPMKIAFNGSIDGDIVNPVFVSRSADGSKTTQLNVTATIRAGDRFTWDGTYGRVNDNIVTTSGSLNEYNGGTFYVQTTPVPFVEITYQKSGLYDKVSTEITQTNDSISAVATNLQTNYSTTTQMQAAITETASSLGFDVSTNTWKDGSLVKQNQSNINLTDSAIGYDVTSQTWNSNGLIQTMNSHINETANTIGLSTTDFTIASGGYLDSLNTTANSKAKTFTSTPTPPYNVGDIWVNAPSGYTNPATQSSLTTVKVCTTRRVSTEGYNSADWTNSDNAAYNINQAQISIQPSQITSTVWNYTSSNGAYGNVIASQINQTATTITIAASKIQLSGSVTLSNILNRTDQTKIDGGSIYTDNLYVGKLYGLNNTSSYATVDSDGGFSIRSSSGDDYISIIRASDTSGNQFAKIISGNNRVLELISGNTEIDLNETITLTPSSGIIDLNGDITTGALSVNGDQLATIAQIYCHSTTPHIYGNGSILELSYDNNHYGVTIANDGFRVTQSGNSTYNLGNGAYKWNDIYANNGIIQTSDRTEKKNIANLDITKIKPFLMGLTPSSYELINGTSGRIHYGIISQDVETLMTNLGMASTDFAGFIKTPVDGGYKYGLRYEEFVAPLILLEQDHEKRLQAIEAKLGLS